MGVTNALGAHEMPVVELCAAAEKPSGYGVCVKQLTDGLLANGVVVQPKGMLHVIDRLASEEKRTKSLKQYPWGPRWEIDGEGIPARFGTKARQFVFDHPLRPLSSASVIDEPTYRDASVIAVGLPESANYDGATRRAVYTMWESTQLPQGFRAWAPHLGRAHVVMVPAENSRQVILQDAPNTDVRIVPLGLNAEDWPLYDRPERDTFTFVMTGYLSIRKGFDLAYDAFWKAFGGRPDVRLVFKTRGSSDMTQLRYWPRWSTDPEMDGSYGYHPDSGQVTLDNARGLPLVRTKNRVRYHVVTDDPTVRILRFDWRKSSLLKLYEHADCFLWPTRGEGWGLPPREAAATGLPVITSAHSGQADAGEWAYVVPHADPGHPAIFRHWGGQCGFWYEPDLDTLVDTMRWVVEHRDEAKAFGRAASEVVTRRPVADVGRDILDVLSTIGD